MAAYANGNHYVARWDGVEWTTFAGDFSGVINSLVQYGDHLYCGGQFDSIDGEPVNNLAWWNGEKWLPYGLGVTGSYWTAVEDMVVYGEKLYLAGTFHLAVANHLITLPA